MIKKKNFDTSKVNKILDLLTNLKYKIEGEDEVLVDIVKSKYKFIDYIIEEKYKFNISNIDNFNKIYELLVKYVQAKLRICYNINKLEIPVTSSTSESRAHSHIFISNDYGVNSKLLILIPDKGDCPPG